MKRSQARVSGAAFLSSPPSCPPGPMLWPYSAETERSCTPLDSPPGVPRRFLGIRREHAHPLGVGEMLPAFEALLSGNYYLEDRMLLRVEVFRDSQFVEHYMALNDAVINKGALARIIEVEVRVDAQLVSTFKGDGLIISTPTGSTAYSLSAGGPIVYPTLEAFIITPICPHKLTNRPVVVHDAAKINVSLLHGTDMMLTVDGQVGMPLRARDSLRLQKASSAVRLVLPGGNTFFKVLREKLKWG